MDYSNILKAINSEGRSLSIDEKNRNYQIFSDLMKNNISLSEVLKQAEQNNQPQTIDKDIFRAMETAVKDDHAVTEARREAEKVKAEIIGEICLKDSRYRGALEKYNKAVSEAYIKNKQTAPEDE